MNGKLKVTLSIAGIVGLVAMLLSIGYNWALMDSHLEDAERHQSVREKEHLIDERVDLHLKPLRVELRLMNKKLDRLLEQQGRTP